MTLFHHPIARTYIARKFMFTLTGTILIALVGVIYSTRAIAVPTAEWFDYARALVLAFWYNHLALFCSICLFWFAVFILNVALPAYNAVTNYREIISHSDVENLRRFRLIARSLWVIFLATLIAFIPIIWPQGIAYQYLASVFGVAACILTVLSSLGFVGKGFGDYRTLLRFDFRRCPFDVASLAPISRQANRAINRNKSTFDVSQLLRNLERLLNVPNDSIRLHTNTTTAYDHAFREMFLNGFEGTPAVVLASDAEYPNITAMLESYESSNHSIQLVRAKIRSLLWQGGSDQQIVDAYLDSIKDVDSKIDVLALCHVHHATGRVLPVLQIAKRLEQEERWSAQQGYLLLDGAQAVGNIHVPSDIWNMCDFYAFCGHKWLLGSPTLGGLFTKRYPRNLPKWSEVPLPAGLSKSCDPNETYGSTAIADARVSLQASTKEFLTVGLEQVDIWNSDLANLFGEKLPLTEAGISPVRISRGGIVAIVADKDRIQRVRTALVRRYGKITCFEDDAVGPGGGKAALRLSFHCFHSRVDIYQLIQHISEAS